MATARTRPHVPTADPTSEEARRAVRREAEQRPVDDVHQVAAVPAPDLAWAAGHAAGPQGRGLDASRTAMILGMQQRFGNRSVQRHVRRAAIRREGAATGESTPVGTGAPTAAPATQAPAGPKTATITLKAYYEDVPGQAKDKVKQADKNDALWLGLEMSPDFPPGQEKRVDQLGMAAGAAAIVDQYPAPVSEGDDSHGRGTIAAQLLYASDRKWSFDVRVTGIKRDVRKATAAARAIIEKRLKTFGDVDKVAEQARTALAETYPGATVEIATVPRKVFDAGRSMFGYKVRGDSTILMDVKAVPVGEREVTVSGSKTGGSVREDEDAQRTTRQDERIDIEKDVRDSKRTKQTSQEDVTVNYNKAVVHTLEDYVSKSTKIHEELTEDLAKKVVADSEYRKGVTWKQDAQSTTVVENYTKKAESGQKDKENFAAKASRWLGGIRKVLDFPLQWIPGRVGKYARKLKNWWVGPALDAGKWVADQFAHKGKVDYTDEDIRKTTTTTVGPTGGRTDVDIDRHDVEQTTQNLKRELTRATQEDWQRHMKDVVNTAEEYRSRRTTVTTGAEDTTHNEDYTERSTKEQIENAKRRKAVENQSTTASFSSTVQWKFTKPVVTATVVDGDAEVRATAFESDAAEKARSK